MSKVGKKVGRVTYFDKLFKSNKKFEEYTYPLTYLPNKYDFLNFPGFIPIIFKSLYGILKK